MNGQDAKGQRKVMIGEIQPPADDALGAYEAVDLIAADRLVMALQEYDKMYREFVIGLSGGIDSSVCLALFVKAFGKERIKAFALPAYDSNPADLEDAKELAGLFQVSLITESIEPYLELLGVPASFAKHHWGQGLAREGRLDQDGYLPDDRHFWAITGSTVAKLMTRTTVLHVKAALIQGAVCQTLNRTELAMGMYGDWGDRAGDIAPLNHLWKTQVYKLGVVLGIPEKIISRPSGSGNLPELITDEQHAGMSYQDLDGILSLHLDYGLEPEHIARYALSSGWEMPIEQIVRIVSAVRANQARGHKPFSRSHLSPLVGIDHLKTTER